MFQEFVEQGSLFNMIDHNRVVHDRPKVKKADAKRRMKVEWLIGSIVLGAVIVAVL